MPEPTSGELLLAQITADLAAIDQELTTSEAMLLDRACDTANTIQLLEESISQVGPMVTGPKGTPIVNPAVVECRLQKHLLANLLGRLNLDGSPSAASQHGRKAANIRWSGRATGRRNS